MPVWIKFEPGEPCQWIVGGGKGIFKKGKKKTDRITLHIFGFSSKTTIYTSTFIVYSLSLKIKLLSFVPLLVWWIGWMSTTLGWELSNALVQINFVGILFSFGRLLVT